MKKYFSNTRLFLLIMLIMPSLCYATHFYEPYITHPNNPNIILVADTYGGNGSNIHTGCFLYKNIEGAKIGGEEFQYEYLCVAFNTNTGSFTTFKENQSKFIYYNNKFTYGNPYYFDRKITQYDIQDMFIDLREGEWSSRI